MQISQLTEELNSARKTIAEKEEQISRLRIEMRDISAQIKVRSFAEHQAHCFVNAIPLLCLYSPTTTCGYSGSTRQR